MMRARSVLLVEDTPHDEALMLRAFKKSNARLGMYWLALNQPPPVVTLGSNSAG